MKRHTPHRFAVDTALLGGTGAWQNLGLWPAPSYDTACERLAIRIGKAADLQPGQRVLELGAGSGAGLALWRNHFGANATGLELETHVPHVVAGPAYADGKLNTVDTFDAIVAVDSAYHLASVTDLARALSGALEPGGVVALTTFTLGRRIRRWPALEALTAMPRGALVPTAQLVATFQTHFRDVRVTSLAPEVLSGFVAHVAARRRTIPLHARLSAGWAKIAVTAALARLGAQTGALDYVLVTARG